MAIVRGARQVRFMVEFIVGPNELTDDELRLYIVGLRNTLTFSMLQAMANVPPPNEAQAQVIEITPAPSNHFGPRPVG